MWKEVRGRFGAFSWQPPAASSATWKSPWNCSELWQNLYCQPKTGKDGGNGGFGVGGVSF